MLIEIVPYKTSWPTEFESFAQHLKEALKDTEPAIYHIGSTSVPNLAAKDVLDIQIVVKDLNVDLRKKLEPLGVIQREDIVRDHSPPGIDVSSFNLEKHYFQKLERRTNIHVRAKGRFNTKYALLCRDYLRANQMAANAYAEIKRQLAKRFPEDADSYYDIKDPVFDVIMAGAFIWEEAIGWQMPESDV